MTAKMLAGFVVLGLAALLLAGCEPAPIVEFATPRIMMHVEGNKILDVEKIRGDVRVQKKDDKFYTVDGTGVVRVVMGLTDMHTVDVERDHIRVHGVNVTTSDVFVEKKNPLPRAVHPGCVKKP